eukprot:365558-Chlamydomonas_euryale.AAC.20
MGQSEHAAIDLGASGLFVFGTTVNIDREADLILSGSCQCGVGGLERMEWGWTMQGGGSEVGQPTGSGTFILVERSIARKNAAQRPPLDALERESGKADQLS